jgi:hypothetical protein
MTWDEIRAAYPPDTWLVLEVVEGECDDTWQHFEPVRVLEVVPKDANPIERARTYRSELSRERVLAFSTREASLRLETVFMGFRIPDADVEPDMEGTPVRVVDLRPPGSRPHARPGGR